MLPDLIEPSVSRHQQQPSGYFEVVVLVALTKKLIKFKFISVTIVRSIIFCNSAHVLANYFSYRQETGCCSTSERSATNSHIVCRFLFRRNRSRNRPWQDINWYRTCFQKNSILAGGRTDAKRSREEAPYLSPTYAWLIFAFVCFSIMTTKINCWFLNVCSGRPPRGSRRCL